MIVHYGASGAERKRLAEVIAQVGHIDRAVDDDLFSSVVHHIVGQQISSKAQATIWAPPPRGRPVLPRIPRSSAPW